jgi:hypothetical protein
MTTRRRPALEVGADDATVDLIDRPGDVGSPFGCQERHQLPDFGRLTQAAQRDRRGDMGRRQGRPPHLPRPRPRRRRRRRLRLDPRPHAVDPSPPRRTTRPVHLLGLRFTRAEQARHAHRAVSAALPQSPGLSGHLSTHGPLGPCPRTWWYVRRGCRQSWWISIERRLRPSGTRRAPTLDARRARPVRRTCRGRQDTSRKETHDPASSIQRSGPGRARSL